MFMESLTTGPELENSQGHFRPFQPFLPAKVTELVVAMK
jgi:hypothetical protein